MLNKPEYKSQTNLGEATACKSPTKVIVELGFAANAPRFGAVKKTERRLRHERRNSQSAGITGSNWRVTSITS